MTDCLNTGSVTGSYIAGGAVGKGYKLVLTRCVSVGNITGSFCTGGFIGYLARDYFAKTHLTSCYALGEVGTAYISGSFAGIVDNEVMELQGVYSSASVDPSLAIIQKDSSHHVFSQCEGVSSITSDTGFDFENVWSLEDGALSLKFE